MQVLFFILFITILILFFISKSDKESKKSKILFLIFVALVVVFALIYEHNSSKNISKNIDILNHFNQSNEIYCSGKVVSNKTFLYVDGTQSFNGKPQTKDSGLIFDIKDCDKR